VRNFFYLIIFYLIFCKYFVAFANILGKFQLFAVRKSIEILHIFRKKLNFQNRWEGFPFPWDNITMYAFANMTVAKVRWTGLVWSSICFWPGVPEVENGEHGDAAQEEGDQHEQTVHDVQPRVLNNHVSNSWWLAVGWRDVPNRCGPVWMFWDPCGSPN